MKHDENCICLKNVSIIIHNDIKNLIGVNIEEEFYLFFFSLRIEWQTGYAAVVSSEEVNSIITWLANSI